MLPTGGWKRGISTGRNLGFPAGTAGRRARRLEELRDSEAAIGIHAAPQ